MTEIPAKFDTIPSFSDPLSCQISIWKLCNEILELKDKNADLPYYDMPYIEDNGNSEKAFLIANWFNYLVKTLPEPTSKFNIQKENIRGYYLKAFGYGESEPFNDPPLPSDGSYWRRELHILIDVIQGSESATVSIGIVTDSTANGALPHFLIGIGGDGHQHTLRPAESVEEVELFVQNARTLTTVTSRGN